MLYNLSTDTKRLACITVGRQSADNTSINVVLITSFWLSIDLRSFACCNGEWKTYHS